MVSRSENKWAWEEETSLRSQMDGGVVKLFKAEGVSQPGILSAGAPPDSTTLFAREAIQNSWDAAREWKNKNKDNKIPPFWLEINFVALTGAKKTKFIDAIGIIEHSKHLKGAESKVDPRREIGLFSEDCLDSLDSPNTPLKIIEVVEHSSLGMPGNFENQESRMFYALLSLGYTVKADGSGGSYGYGKAGLIASSKIRAICAYSCFAEEDDDPGVTRRFMGVTYWGHHKFNSKSFTGWGRLGKKLAMSDGGGESAVPFDNKEADEFAASLDLKVRSANKPDDKGTTFLIVDANLDPHDLKKAIERSWWPAMMDESEGLRVQITDYDGEKITPSIPVDDPDLAPFVRAYELATSEQSSKRNYTKEDTEYFVSLPSMTPSGAAKVKLGTLGLIADPSGWSFPEVDENDNDGVSHCTLIAMIRGPRMVVQYNDYRLGQPYVRGCFVADPEIDDLLRQTEPKAHDKWDEKMNESGIDPSAPKIAKRIYQHLRDEIKNFKGNFIKPAPRSGEFNLPILDELSRIMKGKKPSLPLSDPRTVNINFLKSPGIVPVDTNSVKCLSEVSFMVDDWVWDEIPGVEEVEVELQLSLAVDEDGRIGDARIPLKVEDKSGQLTTSSNEKNKFVGIGLMRQGENIRLKIESEPYSSDWSVRFTPIAEITRPDISQRKKSNSNG